LACRASRHAGARLHESGDHDRTSRASDAADSRRQWWCDAAALQSAEGRGKFQHAQRPFPWQRAPDDFRDQLDELLGYIENRRSTVRPFAARIVLPGRPEQPEPWLLGSSPQSAIWAAELGLPYCFADFINSAGAQVAAHYRQAFVPNESNSAPQLAVAVWVICADDEEQAIALSASFRMMMTLLYRGQLIAVPSPETAQQFLDAEADPGALLQHRRLIVGSPATIRESVEEVAAEYGADEVLLVNILYDHAARRRSYELVAEAFDLSGAVQPSHAI
jgi:luciferase family oxidoreductase group 1